ncbi:uncharacterized protein LOC100878855 [Megachile rotundata]|uniref:uncharacterized protein LOC100878855 n=1 Tax=Megachile rotundata TaxID=143995 RepID=UPI003FD407E0
MENRIKNLSSKKQSEKANNEKKPFNKKKYRLQKYSNDYKINQWEERRKKAILRHFYKDLKEDQRQNLKKVLPSKSSDHEGNAEDKSKQKNSFYKAKQEFLRKKDEKRKQKEEALRIKLEREEALKTYKEKKIRTYKKLSKHTKRGQPVMKDRMEILLEKIQQQVSN